MKKLSPLIALLKTTDAAINLFSKKGRQFRMLFSPLMLLCCISVKSLAQPTFSYATKDFVINMAINAVGARNQRG